MFLRVKQPAIVDTHNDLPMDPRVTADSVTIYITPPPIPR